MTGPLHLHVRKRMYRKLHPFPAESFGKRLLDRVVFIVGVLGPIMTIPQVLEIYVHGNASGVSALSWSIFALFDIPWIIYGIVHKERLIVVTYVLWFIFNALVAVGAVIY